MASKKAKKLTNIVPKQGTQLAVYDDVELNRRCKPQISITYIEKNQYGIKHFFDTHRKQSNRDIIKEFNCFLESVRMCNTLQDMIDLHKPKSAIKNKDDTSQRAINKIRKLYNIDASDMLHLHCKKSGAGQFVLHGFILNGAFHIVWFDTNHEVHEC